jgi:cathepsin B
MVRATCVAALFVASEARSLAEIATQVNSQQTTWVAQAPEKFSSTDDVKTYLGAFLPGDAKHKKLPVKQVLTADVADIPESFDARTQWSNCTVIKNIRDQSSCGSCWAFGSTDSFQDRACIATGKDVAYSAEDTAFCSDAGDGCQGGNTAWDWFTETGVVTGGDYTDKGTGETCLPYSLAPCAHHVPATAKYPACPSGEYPSPRCSGKCSESGYSTSKADDKFKASDAYSVEGVANIQTELMNHGPLYVAFTVYDDFPTYKSGVYKHTSYSALGGHAVELIGWGVESGTDYWLVKNSWNEQWGDGGLFKIVRGSDECGIEDDVSGGTFGGPAPTPSPSPSPSPTPSPSPGCSDTEDSSYCSYVVSQDWCDLIGSDCLKSCNCCDDPSACGGSAEFRTKVLAAITVQV